VPNGVHQEQKFSSLKQKSIAVSSVATNFVHHIQAARPTCAPSGLQQEQKFSWLKQKSIAVSSVATNFVHHIQAARPVRAERLASGAEILLAQAKIHSGVE
jgi:hypothetical protein